MQKNLFSTSDLDAGLDLIITSYFDRIYEDGNFIKMLVLLSNKISMSTDGAYCHFPDINSFDESDHFEGVELAIGYPPLEKDTIITSDATFYEYIRLACDRYIQIHPKEKVKVCKLLDEISLKFK